MKASALTLATNYYRSGLMPLPIEFREKKPTLNNWQNFTVNHESELSQYFNGKPQNIGILLGEPSNDLIDVDLDTSEARRAALYFLPKTTKFGRAGNPASHHLYKSGVSTRKFQDPLKIGKPETRGEAMLVEIRSTGCQTIFPGSTHKETGEQIEWTHGQFEQPLEISADTLTVAVGKLAAAALLASYWRDGIRNELAMAVSGALIRHGFDDADVLHFVKAVCHAAQDEETEDRIKTTQATIRNFRSGGKTTGLPKLIELTDKKIVNSFCKWLGFDSKPNTLGEQPDNFPGTTPDEKPERKTQATKLTELCGDVLFFHTATDEYFAIVPVESHFENLNIKNKAFRSWLTRRYYESEKQTPSAQGLQEALGQLEGKARFDGACHETHVRIAEHENAIFVDLCNETWQAVKIDAAGWQIIESSEVPVKFRRTRGNLPLPTPERGGTLAQFFSLINIIRDDFILVCAWLVCALRPSKPFAMLALHGQQGSAKSTTQRMCRSLIDPNVASLRSAPRDERDLMIAATNAWIVGFDNLSRLGEPLSDSLCRLATGGGFATRELYSDGDEILFDAKRPVMFNGIEEIATRPDLLERCLVISAPRIDKAARRTENDLWREFEAERPKIIGALFTKLSQALKNLPVTNLAEKPRMADFAEFAFAAFGKEFLDRYEAARIEANAAALEASTVALSIQKFMFGRDEWEGTAGELLKLLETVSSDTERKQKDYPKTAHAMAGALKRIEPNLRAAGIAYEKTGNKNGGSGGRNFKLTNEVQNS